MVIIYLMVIAIDKDYQNKGIGTILLQKIIMCTNIAYNYKFNYHSKLFLKIHYYIHLICH